jgi:hypothetical protein
MRYEVSTKLNFNEEKYLAANPDVVQGILRKEFKNGENHFERAGILEQRFQKVSLEKDSPLAVIHVPKCAGTSLRIEIDAISSNMYSGSKYSMRESRPKILRNFKMNLIQSHLEATTWTSKELRAVLNQYECLMGHISMKDFFEAGFDDFLAIVREPRIRLLSEYLFHTSHSEYVQLLEKFKVTNSKSYIRNYASKRSKNKISELVTAEYIFDWSNKDLKFSCYWNDEISKLMMNMFGRSPQNVRVNESRSELPEIDFRTLDLVHELTVTDSELLNRLMNSGILSHQSKEKMDEDFKSYVMKNFTYVKSLI